MPATESSILGLTTVSLAELIAMRARAGKPMSHPAHVRIPLAGGHRSALRGRGMDYAESRVYQPGDDVRNIDWRRTARSGKWHTKLFEEEREQSLLLLIDTHATMRFGTRARYKSVVAAHAAAWLTWTCMRAGDRVGALAFGAVRAATDPHAGSRGALAVLGALARWDHQARGMPSPDSQDEPLSRALQRARRLLAPGSRAMLLSDGWCTDAATHAALVRLTRHVDLRVGILADALEYELAPVGSYVFETANGRSKVDLSNSGTRAAFRDQLAAGWRNLAQACDAARVPWTRIASDAEPDVPLTGLWRQRRRLRS
ncbi:MAG: DUF58 domain-containing protein [Rhodanobacteraceae bacterium]